MAAQASREQRLAVASIVIDHSGSLEDLRVASPRSRPIISAAPLGRELDDDGLGLGEKLCRVQVGLAPDRLFPHALAATTWVGSQLGLAALVTVLRRFCSDALSAAARRFNHG